MTELAVESIIVESLPAESSLTPAVYCSTEIVVLKGDELVAAGWTQRTVTDTTRIYELEELYKSVGFETIIVDLDPNSFGEACNTCAVAACSEYLALFTRK